jgi:disulfide bond formation protein DsbB
MDVCQAHLRGIFMPSIRHTYAIVMIGCVALILGAIYLEHVKNMQPCSLCITQRAFVIMIGILAFVAFIHNPVRLARRSYAIAGVLLAISGSIFAGRQLWLQGLPADQVPVCGPGLAYMFEEFPLADAFKLLMRGDGNCAHIDKVFGLSIPTWTLVAFCGFGIIFLYQACRKDDK